MTFSYEIQNKSNRKTERTEFFHILFGCLTIPIRSIDIDSMIISSDNTKEEETTNLLSSSVGTRDKRRLTYSAVAARVHSRISWERRQRENNKKKHVDNKQLFSVRTFYEWFKWLLCRQMILGYRRSHTQA